MTANTPKARKAKGRIFQQEIANIVRALNPEFIPGDISVAIMGEAGEDIKIPNDKKWLCNLSIECKRVEKLNLTTAWEQAKQRRDRTKDIIPILAHRKSHCEPLVTLNAIDFFTIYRAFALTQRGKYE